MYKEDKKETNVRFMYNLLAGVSTGAIIDIVALAVIIIFAIIGVIQGFTKTFITAFGGILALLLAGLLSSSMSNFLEDKFSFITSVAGKLGGVMKNIFGDVVDTPVGGSTEDLLTKQGIAMWLVKLIFSIKTEVPPETTINSIICPIFAYYVVVIISFIVLFILFKILFALLSRIVKSLYVFKLVLATDKVLGLVLGIARGIIIVQILILVINIIPIGFFQNIALNVQYAKFTNFINSINIFNAIINSISSNNLLDIIKGIVIK